MITCNFCGIDQPNRALAAHQTTSASCLTIQLKTALARTDAAEKERDDARGALAVETRNANRLAHDRNASRAEVERLRGWMIVMRDVDSDYGKHMRLMTTKALRGDAPILIGGQVRILAAAQASPSPVGPGSSPVSFDEDLSAALTESRAEVELLKSALRPLAQIADRFDDSRLDEHRPEWGAKDPKSVELLTGRGGGLLLSLDDALTARAALAAEVKP